MFPLGFRSGSVVEPSSAVGDNLGFRIAPAHFRNAWLFAAMHQGQSTTESSEALLSAARSGSQEALGTLFQSFRTYLLVVGERELRSDLRVKVSASDLVQETFAEGQRALNRFLGSTPAEFQAWLRGILLNKLANARRRYLSAESRDLKREERQDRMSSIIARTELLIAEQDSPSEHAERLEDAQRIRVAIGRLPSHYRQVIELRNFEVLPFAEIATVMNRSEHELRALWVRALNRLKENLDGFTAE